MKYLWNTFVSLFDKGCLLSPCGFFMLVMYVSLCKMLHDATPASIPWYIEMLAYLVIFFADLLAMVYIVRPFLRFEKKLMEWMAGYTFRFFQKMFASAKVLVSRSR